MFSDEERGAAVVAERCPVAAYYAVAGDDGLENAAVVVRLVAEFRRKHYVAAFVADKVFVVGRDEKAPTFAETACATIIGIIKIPL